MPIWCLLQILQDSTPSNSLKDPSSSSGAAKVETTTDGVMIVDDDDEVLEVCTTSSTKKIISSCSFVFVRIRPLTSSVSLFVLSNCL